MRILTFLLFSISSLLASQYNLKPIKISKEIYCFFGKPEEINTHNNGNMVNSCFVDTGKSYIVIDSGSTYLYAKEATNIIQSIKNIPIKNVIVTHAHDDHWLGNSYYRELGADIIGSFTFDSVTITGDTRMKRLVSPEAYSGTYEFKPTKIINQNTDMQIDGLEIKLQVNPNKAHSTGDITVAIPAMGILFAGDLVFNDRILSIRDGDINHWIKALEEIDSNRYQYIIGGHGKMYKNKSHKMTLQYLKDIQKHTSSCISKNIDILECINSGDMEKYSHISLYKDLHKKNIESIYRTMEWENE